MAFYKKLSEPKQSRLSCMQFVREDNILCRNDYPNLDCGAISKLKFNECTIQYHSDKIQYHSNKIQESIGTEKKFPIITSSELNSYQKAGLFIF